MRFELHSSSCALLLFLFPVSLLAKTYYLDPVSGDMSNPGTLENPWGALQLFFEQDMFETQSYTPLPYVEGTSTLQVKNSGSPVKPGDTLLLLDGHHGSVFYRGAYNMDYLTIKNAPGHSPSVSNIEILATSKFIFEGLIISPETAPTYTNTTLFNIINHGHHGPSRDITLKNCQLFSVSNSAGWGLTEWNNVGSAIRMSGNQMRVINNTCRNIDDGIAIFGDSALIQKNQVINFAGDGMRGQGSYLIFEDNLVKNCFDVNDNHDDGFQAFTSRANPFVGNILRRNIIMNYDNPNQPFKGALQGIGCFDGTYKDWIVENNLIIVNHFHGITFLGAENCKVVNNTVIDIDLNNSPNGTWIRVTDHKDGTPSQNCIVNNNIAFGMTLGAGVSGMSNIIINDYNHFQLRNATDYVPVATSTLVNSGVLSEAPDHDIYGRSRPQNGGIDIGAFELPACTSQNFILSSDVIEDFEIFLGQWFSTAGNILFSNQTSSHIMAEQYINFTSGISISQGSEVRLEIGDCDAN